MNKDLILIIIALAMIAAIAIINIVVSKLSKRLSNLEIAFVEMLTALSTVCSQLSGYVDAAKKTTEELQTIVQKSAAKN